MDSTGSISDQTRKKSQKHPLLWILDLLLEKKLLFLWIVIGIIIHQSLRFVIPVFIGDLVEFGVENRDYDQVRYYAILILITAIISAFFDLTMSWGNEVAANDIEKKVRSIYFRAIQNKRMSFHEDAKIGELMAIAQNDMRSLYTALAPGMRIFGEAIVSILAITAIIFWQSWMLGILFVLMLPFWYLSLVYYNRRLTPVAIEQQNNFREVSSEVQENLSGAEVVRAFSQERNEIDQFDTINDAYTESWEYRGKVTALYFPMLVAYSLSGVLFLGAAYLAITPIINIGPFSFESNFGLGGLVTIIALIIQFRGPTFLVGRVLEFSSLGLAGVRKIQNILAEDETLPIPDNPITKEIKGEVEYNHVFFKYNEESEHVIKDISFKANPGDVVAIVGPTGSGKTTMLKLLTRLYDVSDGSIKIDGIDVRKYNPNSLRKSIAVVEQDVFLFSTTIRENIAFALNKEDVEEENIKEVSRIARVNEFVYDLPDGFDTVVGERGVRLSGGQKQRIAIARAFLTDPKILVLDDSTSAVDSETEQQIVSAMKKLMEGRTSFIITTRLNMIRQATKILVLENGEIVDQGTHDDLLHRNEIYRRIFDPHIELPELEVRE